MNIEFEQIEIQNFKSVGDLTIIDFQNLKNLNYIYGTNLDSPQSRNACGKSVFFIDSLVFALFGKTLRNTNNQYIPNRNCDSSLKSYAKLYFKSNGIRYSSECYCKPKIGTVGMTLLKYNEEANEWEDLTQSSVVKTRQYIQENLLGCTFDIFKSSIIISASDFLNFFEGMNKQAKKNYIENIFNLNCFGIMYSEIKSDINDLKKEISYCNNEVIKAGRDIEQLTLKFNDFDNKMNSQLNDVKKDILSKATLLKEKQSEFKKLEESLVNKAQVEADYQKINLAIEKIKTESHKLALKISKNENTIKSYETIISDINNMKQGLCEACSLLIEEKMNFDKYMNLINELGTEINELENKTTNLKTTAETLELKKTELKENVELLNDINNNKVKIGYVIENLTKDILSLKSKYDELLVDKNPFAELLNNLQVELNNLKSKLTTYDKNFKHLEILREACSENGIKRFIIKDIVKLLNSLIQKYLNEIGAEYLVYFDEFFDFKFITNNGECEFSNFSAGERQRIQIATMFAFRDLILNGKISSNIFIIDEMLDTALDSIAIKNILNILAKKSTECGQNIFIISHRSETIEDNIFSNIIEVVKENGISTIKIN
jgi:DNA repair exonuclease SbcCD ATPase subunit